MKTRKEDRVRKGASPNGGAAQREAVTALRNIGLMAHIDAGKTTVTERILFYTGRIHRTGEVHDGRATMDFLEEEQARGITIAAAATRCAWRGVQINLIDTPGHVDFTAEVQRSLRVLDGAVAIFDAVAGVEAQSEAVWRQADRYGVARLAFINKMDRVGADFDRAVASIRERLGARAVPVTYPIGAGPAYRGLVDLVTCRAVFYDDATAGRRYHEEPVPAELTAVCAALRRELVEAAVETDDALLARYLEGEEPTPAELRRALRRAVVGGKLVPVLCGSALRNKGIQRLLDAVADYLPHPRERGRVEALDRGGNPVRLVPAPEESLAALAFKTVAGPGGDLTFVRVYAGVLRTGDTVLNVPRGRRERIGRLVVLHADKQEPVSRLEAGQIGAVVGLRATLTGDTLAAPDRPVVLEPMEFPEPVIQVAVRPARESDRDALSRALAVLAREDPTFRRRTDGETGETLVAGMGELHLEVLLNRLRRDFRLAVEAGAPRVAYRQTLARSLELEARHVKQTGGRGQFGVVKLAFAPEDTPEVTFTSRIVGGAVPRQFVPAVERGVREALAEGYPLGFPFIGVAVTLVDGRHHEVDSSEAAFRAAARKAVREAAARAGVVILEPLMEVEVSTPEESLRAVLAGLNARRAQLAEIAAAAGGLRVVRGLVPLAEMFGYATVLRSATQGRGSFLLRPARFARAPEEVAAEVRRRALAAGRVSP